MVQHVPRRQRRKAGLKITRTAVLSGTQLAYMSRGQSWRLSHLIIPIVGHLNWLCYVITSLEIYLCDNKVVKFGRMDPIRCLNKTHHSNEIEVNQFFNISRPQEASFWDPTKHLHHESRQEQQQQQQQQRQYHRPSIRSGDSFPIAVSKVCFRQLSETPTHLHRKFFNQQSFKRPPNVSVDLKFYIDPIYLCY